MSSPFGPGTLFSRVQQQQQEAGADATAAAAADDEKNPDDGILRRRTREEGGSRGENCMDSDEAIYAAYLAYEIFPESTMMFSSFSAGPGQLTFGSGVGQKADVCLSIPQFDSTGKEIGRRLAFFNYHSSHFHLARNEKEAMDSVEGDKVFYHRPDCSQAKERVFDALPRTTWNYRDVRIDEQKVLLAQAMTRAAADAGVSITFTYDWSHECEVNHSFGTFCPSNLGSGAPVRLKEGGIPYSSMRQLLHSVHGDRVLRTCKKKCFTQKELVAKILKEKDNKDGGRFGGFLFLKKGSEQRGQGHEDSVGYCFQRCKTRPEDLGLFTRFQIWKSVHGDESAYNKKIAEICSKEQTVLRSSFEHADGECISLDYFR